MKESTTEVKEKHMSLSEYAWSYQRVNDMTIEKADKMKEDAWKVKDIKVRTKKNKSTPLLTPSDWEGIWEKHYDKN